ncbi:MAG: LysM peptidoglycan-binding domain-containing protein [Candidatus Desulforudis sp.]|nr:LysM peptidoglycan-binding domain-containing protein [Desulforudis sp.]
MAFRVFRTMLCACVLLLFSGTAAFAATYTVQPGDSLFKIAQRFGISTQELQSANGLGNRTVIVPGQQLNIPGSPTHVVRSGESLFKIAARYGISTQDLMRANALMRTEIYPGQVLRIPVGAPDPAPSRWSVSRSDFDLLARIITAEADCQPFLVKVAVGAVVLNRVKSHLFPNSIAGVVYDRAGGRYQFEPVLNGWINRAATPESVRAAQAALEGQDPSWGALFFFEPWVTNRFLHNLPVARDLGAFRFTYAR